MGAALAHHGEILRGAVADHGDQVVKATGDGPLRVLSSGGPARGISVCCECELER